MFYKQLLHLVYIIYWSVYFWTSKVGWQQLVTKYLWKEIHLQLAGSAQGF